MKDNINSYLSFSLGQELFASHVLKIVNILELVKITEVPLAPNYMKGVINLRGTVLPVIDTRVKFGFSPIKYNKNTCIIVLSVKVEDEEIEVGALVDSVSEVLSIADNKIQPPPSIGNKYKSEFIEGMIEIDDKFIMLLNMDKVLSSDEIIMIQQKTQDAKEEKEKEAEKEIEIKKEATEQSTPH